MKMNEITIKNKLRSNLFWILFVFLMGAELLSGLACIPFELILYEIETKIPSGLFNIMEVYTIFIASVFVLFLMTWFIKPNRYIWKSFLLPKKHKGDTIEEEDILADFYGRNRNSLKMLGLGCLLGFLMNGFCVASALLHGDIKLYFDASIKQFPLFLFALISVWIQSSSEEMWCRGFLYERIHERYPLWIAFLVNGVLFGIMHIFNEGATVLSVLSIMIVGVSFSLIRWYIGNIWIVMGIHTAWNYTQAFLFGLPNSGFVSKLSIFHLAASNGVDNMIYNYTFGVEGCLPDLVISLGIIALIVILAVKDGRFEEFKVSRAAGSNAGI